MGLCSESLERFVLIKHSQEAPNVTRELEFDAASLTGANPNADEAVFRSVNLVQLGLKYRWWLAAGATCGVLLGMLMYLRSGPEYEATAQILVSRKDSVPIREEQRMLSNFGERSEHIALILSPMIINKAIEIGKLDELPAFHGAKDLAGDIIEDLRVKRSSGQDRSYMNVLTITYPSQRKEDARAVVNAVIAAYEAYLEQTRREKSNEVLTLTQQALAEVEVKLHDKEQEYHAFRDSAPLQWKAPVGTSAADGQKTTNVHQERVIAAEEQRRLNLLRKATLESRLIAVEEGVKNKEPRETLEVLIRRFLAQDGPLGSEFQQQQQQDIALFESRLLPMILEEQQLLRDYGDDHPDVLRIRKSIATALDFYRRQGLRLPEERRKGLADGAEPQDIDFVALYTESLRQELAELVIRDRQLALLVESESTKAKSVARLQAKDEAMYAELARLRELWGQLVTQVNQVGIERDGSGYVLRQIAPVHEQLSIKRVMKFLGGGGFLGAFLVAGLCLFRELSDLRIKTVSELRHAVMQPLLGTIGHFSGTVDPGATRSTLHPALRYLLSPRSTEAENYRALRSALTVIGQETQATTLLMTSPESGDGKTTTVANLAIAIAQSGKKVLLIDADLRRPTAHHLFQLSGDLGLVDVLHGEIDPLTAARQTSVEHLMVLTAGQPPSNPAELLSGPRLATALRELQSEFDLILIDSPPLLAVSDPCVIARQTDGVLLVMRLGKTNLNTARRARDVIATHGLRVVGLVANDVPASDGSSYNGDDVYYRDVETAAARSHTRLTPEATATAGV